MDIPHFYLLKYALLEVRLMNFYIAHTSTCPPLPHSDGRMLTYQFILDDIRRIRGKFPYMPSRS